MFDDEVAPQAVTLARHKLLRVSLVLLAIAIVASPVVYYGVRRALLRSQAQTQLDALPVPAAWVADALGDRYEGPMLGRTKYASVTRAYHDLPVGMAELAGAGAQVAAEAGWTTDESYDATSKEPTCRPYYDGCWAMGGYRLFLDVSATGTDCPGCSSIKLMISYKP